MDIVTDRLQEWVAHDLLSAAQAEGIRTFEAQRAAPPPSPGRTSLAEAIGYVGAALALGAIGLLLSQLWMDLLVGGRLALVSVLTVAVFGAALALRTAETAALRRLTNVLCTATVGGVGWFTSVVGTDLLELRDAQLGVSIAVAVLVVAAVFYRWRGGALLQLATLAGALATASFTLALSPIDPGALWYGIVLATVGTAWFLLALGGWLLPRVLGQVTGALAALLGVLVASAGDTRGAALAVGVLAAAVLVWLAVHRDELHHLVVSALALFILAPQLVFELFGDAIGAPATLLLVGLLLVLLAVGLGRARREVVPERTAPPAVPEHVDATGGAS